MRSTTWDRSADFDLQRAPRSDKRDVSPLGFQTYGGDAAVASLRAFRAYSRNAHIGTISFHGEPRWLTDKQGRLYAIFHRIANGPGGLVTMRSIAQEAQVAPGTASKFLQRLQAWGVFGAITVRGRNGGVWLFAREVKDAMDHYAEAARTAIRKAKIRAKARFLRTKLNVSTMFTNGWTGSVRKVQHLHEQGTSTTTVRMVETFSETFKRAVLWERARLALVDPDGEWNAVQPLTREQAIENLALYAPQARSTGGSGGDLADLIGADRGRGSGRVACPAHGEGRKTTLAYRWTDQGGLLVKCHAGCTYDEIRRAVGL